MVVTQRLPNTRWVMKKADLFFHCLPCHPSSMSRTLIIVGHHVRPFCTLANITDPLPVTHSGNRKNIL